MSADELAFRVNLDGVFTALQLDGLALTLAQKRLIRAELLKQGVGS